MKIQELRKKNIKELKVILINLLREKFGLYMQKNNHGESKKNHIVKALRRTIAQTKTLITEKTKEENEKIARNHRKQ